MKRTLLFWLALALSAGAQEMPVTPAASNETAAPVAAPEAQDPDPFGSPPRGDGIPRVVQVQVEYVEMSHELLTELLFLRNPETADATELRKQVQEKVKKGEAKVLETQLVTGTSGYKHQAEAVQVFIYPTSIEGPGVPHSVSVPDTPENTGMKQAMALAALIGPPTPSSFMTRNVGSTLGAEAIAHGDNRTISLNLSSYLTWHPGNTVWMERKDPLDNVAKVQMPDFYQMQLEEQLMVDTGKYTLAGVLSPKDPAGNVDYGRKVMIFIKANALRIR